MVISPLRDQASGTGHLEPARGLGPHQGTGGGAGEGPAGEEEEVTGNELSNSPLFPFS